jgi:hypothetical protein
LLSVYVRRESDRIRRQDQEPARHLDRARILTDLSAETDLGRWPAQSDSSARRGSSLAGVGSGVLKRLNALGSGVVVTPPLGADVQSRRHLARLQKGATRSNAAHPSRTRLAAARACGGTCGEGGEAETRPSRVIAKVAAHLARRQRRGSESLGKSFCTSNDSASESSFGRQPFKARRPAREHSV